MLDALLVRRSVADPLIVKVEADLVARRGLSRQTDGLDHLRRGAARLQAVVAQVGPFSRIAGVLVAEEAGDVLVVSVAPDVVEEPQPVLHDWPTEGEVRIPVLDQSGYVGEAIAAQCVVEIVALRPLAGRAEKPGAAELVAARLGHEVEGGAATVRFTESAGNRHLDFR